MPQLRDATAVTCACWLAAFLLGSVPLGHLVHRAGLRRDLRRLEGGRRRRRAPADLRALLGGGVVDPAAALPSLNEVTGAVLDTAKVLGLAAGVLVVVRAASPRLSLGGSDALALWQWASLWAALAAGTGHLWSMWLGFRSAGQPQVPLLGVAVRFAPIGFVVAVAGYLLGRVGGAERLPVLLSIGGFVGWSWAAWIWDLPHWWGYAPGADLAVWSAVMAGVVAARNLRPHPPAVDLSPRS